MYAVMGLNSDWSGDYEETIAEFKTKAEAQAEALRLTDLISTVSNYNDYCKGALSDLCDKPWLCPPPGGTLTFTDEDLKQKENEFIDGVFAHLKEHFPEIEIKTYRYHGRDRDFPDTHDIYDEYVVRRV